MGKIVERIKLQNLREPSRQTEVDAVVDTGATMLVLPLDVIEQLGLEKFRQVNVRYANGATAQKGLYHTVTIEIQNRVGHFDVLGEERGSQPLIGQTVLEQLDLIVNPKSRQLTPNPESPDMPLLELLDYR